MKLNPSFLRPASVAALVLLAFDCSAQPASAAPSARIAPGASAAPASPARAACLRRRRDRARHAAGDRSRQSLQRGRRRQAEPGGARARCRASTCRTAVEQRLRDRPGHAQGGRHVRGRHQPAARRAVVGPEDAVGHEQRRGHAPTAASRRSIPKTGKPGKPIAVDDPYNMYFTPDGKSAIVVAEALKRLDFRDPQTMALQSSLDDAASAPASTTPTSRSTARSRSSPASSSGSLVKIDMVEPQGARLPASCRRGGMPQDIRVSPDGKHLLRRRHDARRRVHDRRRDASPRPASSRPASARTASTRAATARSSTSPTAARTRSTAPPNGPGSVSVLDFATAHRSTRPGRSPAAAAPTWATSAPTARRCGSAAATTTSSTRSTRRPARSRSSRSAREPHGLTVWPQPGRYSLGHTGNMR